MHSVLERILESYERRSRDLGRRALTCASRAASHRWHGFSRGARPIGFLLFHRHVIEHFTGTGLDRADGHHALHGR
jgi:hypothetical protein